MRVKVIFFFLLLTGHAYLAAGQDNTRMLTIGDFFSMIMHYHPVAKQAALLTDQAKQELRISRGTLDPSIGMAFGEKQFQSRDYYTLWNNYLKIPTWYGIDLKAGFERNTGAYVNGEDQTPRNGLSYIGISVPIGQGLVIDQRRAQIRQAQQLAFIAEAERVKLINKLLLQASKDYYDWMYHHYKFQFYQEGYELARIRYQGIKQRAQEGDLASIDTVESQMQVQNLLIQLTQAEVDRKNAGLMVSNYLWNEQQEPLEMSPELMPSDQGTGLAMLSEGKVHDLIERAKTNHPDLVKLNAKLAQFNIERKMLADKFKPKLVLDYNVLQTGFPVNGEAFQMPYASNNYKVGVSFSYPLFLRQERGKFQLTRLKIQDIEYQLQQTNREIINGIYSAANDWVALGKQISVQENLVRNADALRIGELQKFENGESSVFLVNSRENAIISYQIKLYELKAKYAKSKVSLHWAAGQINTSDALID